MGFQPEVNAPLIINGQRFAIGQHPNAPTIPYGQEGRQGTVYLLHSEDRRRKKAMKVFRSKFVNPSLVYHTQQIAKFSGVEGLLACERFIVTPQNNTELLREEPDLLYAVVMSWIEGPTWMDMLLNKQKLTRRQSHSAAYALAQALVAMEQRGLSHGDLSAPNVMLPMFGERGASVRPIDYVQLIDLEQMYASHLERPEHLPVGSPGYASQRHPLTQMWGPYSDRFAGAVLLTEMLGACLDSFFDSTWGESYFAPEETQSYGERYARLVEFIRSEWGEAIVSLFIRAWDSNELSQCPTFGEWMIELAKTESGSKTSRIAASAAAISAIGSGAKEEMAAAAQEGQLKRARQYESKGKYLEAMDVYRSILQRNPNANLAKEIAIALESLTAKQDIKQNESRERNRRRFSSMRRIATISAIVGCLGIGGYFAFGSIKDFINKAGSSQPSVSVDELKLKVANLEADVADKNAQIKEMKKQIEHLSKPLSQKQEDMLMQLSQDYEQIRKAAETKADSRTDPSQLVFEASQSYMNHLHNYLIGTYQWDSHFVEQLKAVEGYYYPFMYNHNRNAQLNIRFFNDYKDHLTGRGSK
ncbi:hypothetical protein [Cohnella cellulosilytica]|uniref:Protein kinase domain-containing protein n=1 Tax=Cohnella cellulosilytica TaxID=986710 RepID=A0ABW2F8C2_9BACL